MLLTVFAVMSFCSCGKDGKTKKNSGDISNGSTETSVVTGVDAIDASVDEDEPTVIDFDTGSIIKEGKKAKEDVSSELASSEDKKSENTSSEVADNSTEIKDSSDKVITNETISDGKTSENNNSSEKSDEFETMDGWEPLS